MKQFIFIVLVGLVLQSYAATPASARTEGPCHAKKSEWPCWCYNGYKVPMPWLIKGLKKCQDREEAQAKEAGKPYRRYAVWGYYWPKGEKRWYRHNRHCDNDYPNRVTDDAEWDLFMACIKSKTLESEFQQAGGGREERERYHRYCHKQYKDSPNKKKECQDQVKACAGKDYASHRPCLQRIDVEIRPG